MPFFIYTRYLRGDVMYSLTRTSNPLARWVYCPIMNINPDAPDVYETLYSKPLTLPRGMQGLMEKLGEKAAKAIGWKNQKTPGIRVLILMLAHMADKLTDEEMAKALCDFTAPRWMRSRGQYGHQSEWQKILYTKYYAHPADTEEKKIEKLKIKALRKGLGIHQGGGISIRQPGTLPKS